MPLRVWNLQHLRASTAIGCITAASEYFDELTDRVSYSTIVALISIACMVFANLGLNQIIVLFIPVLMILYPICIMLIFLGLIRDLLPKTDTDLSGDSAGDPDHEYCGCP